MADKDKKEKDSSTPTNNSREMRQSESRDKVDFKDTEELSKVVEWVSGLNDATLRVNSLIQLSKKREVFPDLAVFLWYTPGVISVLLQEIIETYNLLAPPNMTTEEANHTCNVLALFQCIAAHPETRPHLLNAQIPIFLYPFLNTVNKSKPFEYLRLTALGVIGALVKIDNSEVINFLLTTEIIPLCLRIMERGSELSKTVATFIVQRILLDESGLSYVCNTAERFYAVSSVLIKIISGSPSTRLVKHIVRCYARLSENQRVNSIMKENLPLAFKDKNFIASLDDSSRKWVQVLMKNILANSATKSNNNMSTYSADRNNPSVHGNYNQSPLYGNNGASEPYYYNPGSNTAYNQDNGLYGQYRNGSSSGVNNMNAGNYSYYNYDTTKK